MERQETSVSMRSPKGRKKRPPLDVTGCIPRLIKCTGKFRLRVTFAFNAVGAYLYKRVKLYQTKTTVDKTMKTLTQAFKRTHEIFRHI